MLLGCPGYTWTLIAEYFNQSLQPHGNNCFPLTESKAKLVYQHIMYLGVVCGLLVLLFGICMFVQPTGLKRRNKLIEALRRGPCRRHLGSDTKKSPTPKQKVLAFQRQEKGIGPPKHIFGLCERLFKLWKSMFQIISL